MEFEWDTAKNQANYAKHGVWFEEAAALWENGASEYPAPHFHENRWMKVLKIRDKDYLVVYTKRINRVRIISARRIGHHERRKLGRL